MKDNFGIYKTEQMSKAGLHSNYLVIFRDGSKGIVTRVNQKNFTKIVQMYRRKRYEPSWYYVSTWNDNLEYLCKDGTGERVTDKDIMSVYGLPMVTDSYNFSDIFNTDVRPLLWKRKQIATITQDTLRTLLNLDKDTEIVIL